MPILYTIYIGLKYIQTVRFFKTFSIIAETKKEKHPGENKGKQAALKTKEPKQPRCQRKARQSSSSFGIPWLLPIEIVGRWERASGSANGGLQ